MSTTEEIAAHFNGCYEKAKDELGDKFDQIMASLAETVIDFQYDPEHDIMEYYEAAILLSIPDEKFREDNGYSEEEEARCNMLIKASVVWWIMEEEKARV